MAHVHPRRSLPQCTGTKSKAGRPDLASSVARDGLMSGVGKAGRNEHGSLWDQDREEGLQGHKKEINQ